MKKISKIVASIVPFGVVIPSVILAVALTRKQSTADIEQEKKNVKTMNNLLAEGKQAGLTFNTMFSVVQYLNLKGVDIETLPAAGNNQYVWDADKNVIFTLSSNNKVVASPDDYVLNADRQRIWKMVDLPESNTKIEKFAEKNEFSQYIRKEQNHPSVLKFSTGLDMGYNTGYNLEYTKPTTNVSRPIINTNKSDLTIHGSASDIDHHGNAKSLTIVSFHTQSKYNEYGSVDSNVIIKGPTSFVAKPASQINTIYVEKEAKDSTIKIEQDQTTEIPGYVGTVAPSGEEKFTPNVDDSAVTKQEDKPTVLDEEPARTERYHSGFGTLNSPFIISTKQQMVNAAEDVNNSSRTSDTFYFKLFNDIDLESTDWTPIGKSKDLAFKGVFDGNGYTISNLKIVQTLASEQSAFGLFGWVHGGNQYNGFDTISHKTEGDKPVWDETGNKLIWDYLTESSYSTVIKDITLEKVNINLSGKAYSTGGLVGIAQNAYIYNNNVVSGEIASYKTIGGLIGNMGATACVNCTCGKDDTGSTLKVTASDYNIGGILGMPGYSRSSSQLDFLHNNAIIGCSTGKNCTITSSQNNSGGSVGGIVGTNFSSQNCIIDACENNANVVAINEAEISSDSNTGIAGIAGFGQSFSVIANCNNKRDITIPEGSKTLNVAGITCKPNANLIYKCSNSGNITGYATNGVAGIVAGANLGPTGAPLQIVECTNTAETLHNDNQNPQYKTAEICAGITVVKFVGQQFKDIAALKTTIDSVASSADDQIILTFKNCNVENKIGTLELPTNTATITSDEALCNNIKVGGNLTKSFTFNIPNQKINVTDQSECKIISTGINNTITIEENAKVKSVSVRGEGSKIINNGTVTRTIGIDGAADSGVNNGTCANVTFGKDVVISNDKSFENNGTISGLTDSTDTCNSVIYAKGDATDLEPKNHTINFTNNGTISYQNNSLSTPASFFQIDALCIHIVMTCNNNSILKTDTANKWTQIFNKSDSILLKYQPNAQAKQVNTDLSYPDLANLMDYTTAQPIE